MSSTDRPEPARQPLGHSRPRRSVMQMLSMLATAAGNARVNDVKSITVNGVTGQINIETSTIGDVAVLVGALRLPSDGITVAEAHDIGVVRTESTATLDGWALHIQHVTRTPTITQEGQPST